MRVRLGNFAARKRRLDRAGAEITGRVSAIRRAGVCTLREVESVKPPFANERIDVQFLHGFIIARHCFAK